MVALAMVMLHILAHCGASIGINFDKHSLLRPDEPSAPFDLLLVPAPH